MIPSGLKIGETGRAPRPEKLALFALVFSIIITGAAAAADAPDQLIVEEVDLPFRPGIGSLGFMTMPAANGEAGDRLLEFGRIAPGNSNSRIGLSEIVTARTDGLVRRRQLFSELRTGVLAVAELEQPFAIIAGNRVENNLITRLIEVRHGPELTERRLLLTPFSFNSIRDVALVDPISATDFHYLLVTYNHLFMMHSESDEPLWQKSLDDAARAVSFRPDPSEPTRLAVGTDSQLFMLDPANGDVLNQWPLSAHLRLRSARLVAGGGEQLLVAGFSAQGIVAFDPLTGESLWQAGSSGWPGLHVHDIDGDGLDEILIGRGAASFDYVIEWRDASGAVLHQGTLVNPFEHAVVFDLLGQGEPQVLLSYEAGSRRNPLLSLDLQTLHEQPRAEPSNFSRFSAGQAVDGEPTLNSVPGIHPFPEPFYEPKLRSINRASGVLRWVADLDPSLVNFVRDVTGFDAGEPTWQFGSVYVLARTGNASSSSYITEVEANTGEVLRSREIDLDGDKAHRLLAIELGGNPRLLLVSSGGDGTRYHLMNPQFLTIDWSSPPLPFGYSGSSFLLDIAGDSHMLITQPTSANFNGTRLVDLPTGDILFDPGPWIVAAALVHDREGNLLVAAHNSNQVLRLHDPDGGEVVFEASLGLDLTAIKQAGPSLLLLAETDRIHLYDLDAGAIVRTSGMIGAGSGVARGFVPDPVRPDCWLIGNFSGIYAVHVISEVPLFRDRFEALDFASQACPWK